MDWDRAKIKEALEILAQLPDFDNMLFPDSWANEFNIPMTPARAIDLREFLRKHKQSLNAPGNGKFEIREPAPGGVREIKVEDKLEIEHKFAIVEGDKPVGFILEDKKEETQTLLSPTGSTEPALPFDGNGATGE